MANAIPSQTDEQRKAMQAVGPVPGVQSLDQPMLNMQAQPAQPQVPQVNAGTQPSQPTSNVGPVPGASVQAITPQNTTAYSSITPQQTPQQQQLQNYQMQMAAQAANAPQYNYGGIGQQQTQQGTQAMTQALGVAGSLPGYGNYGPITNGRTDAYSTAAASRLGGVGSVGGASADATALRQALMQAQGALQGPDRSALAASNFDLLQQAYEPKFQQELRGVGQKAAALGRIGAGMTTSDLGDVAQRKNEFFGRAAQQLSNDAAAQTLQDRLNVLGGTQSALGAVEGMDQGWAGLGLQGQGLGLQASNALFNQGAALRGEEMANRNFDFGVDQSRNQLGLQQAGALGSLGGQAFGMGQGLRGEQFGYDRARYGDALTGLGAISGVGQQMYSQNAGDRAELRGERGYQQGLDQQAQQDMIQQMLLEEQLLGGQYGRNIGAFNSLFNAGYGTDPSNAYRYQGQLDQGQANTAFDGVGNLLQNYFAGQVGGGQGSTAGGAVAPAYQPSATNLPYGGFGGVKRDANGNPIL